MDLENALLLTYELIKQNSSTIRVIMIWGALNRRGSLTIPPLMLCVNAAHELATEPGGRGS